MILIGGPNPMFLSAVSFGGQAPQVRFFDVFYTLPPVVGFHVIGDVDE